MEERGWSTSNIHTFITGWSGNEKLRIEFHTDGEAGEVDPTGFALKFYKVIRFFIGCCQWMSTVFNLEANLLHLYKGPYNLADIIK